GSPFANPPQTAVRPGRRHESNRCAGRPPEHGARPDHAGTGGGRPRVGCRHPRQAL
ncbi:MAG: hypothetical protein AVDCRST_MAG64-1570, partial [uncultured Phycisphaerae bacterium]